MAKTRDKPAKGKSAASARREADYRHREAESPLLIDDRGNELLVVKKLEDAA